MRHILIPLVNLWPRNAV